MPESFFVSIRLSLSRLKYTNAMTPLLRKIPSLVVCVKSNVANVEAMIMSIVCSASAFPGHTKL